MKIEYYRVTGYYPDEDTSVIIDSHGVYKELWQLSSALIKKGFKILEVSSNEKFIDVNIAKAEPEWDKIILRASASGKPENTTHLIDGITYQAIKVGKQIYIPDRNRKV